MKQKKTSAAMGMVSAMVSIVVFCATTNARQEGTSKQTSQRASYRVVTQRLGTLHERILLAASSSDGCHLAYVTVGPSAFRVVVDGQEGPDYDATIHGPRGELLFAEPQGYSAESGCWSIGSANAGDYALATAAPELYEFLCDCLDGQGSKTKAARIHRRIVRLAKSETGSRSEEAGSGRS